MLNAFLWILAFLLFVLIPVSIGASLVYEIFIHPFTQAPPGEKMWMKVGTMLYRFIFMGGFFYLGACGLFVYAFFSHL